jgi:hypothetical protein
MTYDVDIDEAFGLLHSLSDLTVESCSEAFTPRNVLLVRNLWLDLFDEELDSPIKGASEFVQILKALIEKEAYWSKTMGVALIEADRLANLGDTDKAVATLDEFLSGCPSPSFREIAEIQKENYLGTPMPGK